MKKIALFYALLTVFLIISSVNRISCKGKEIRLLIGLRFDSANGAVYQTLMCSDIGSIKMTKSNQLFVPYQNRIFGIKEESFRYQGLDPDWNIKSFKMVPVQELKKERPLIKNANSIKLGSVYEVSRESKILYLNPKYLCVQGQSWYSIRGEMAGSMYSGKSFINVLSLKNYRKISLKEVYGEKVLPIIKKLHAQRITEKDLAEGNQDLDCENAVIIAGANTTDEYHWGVTRMNGRWVAQLAKVWDEQYESMQLTRYAMYNVLPELPEAFAINNSLHPGWNAIKLREPNATDGILAPNHSFMILVTPGKIQYFSHPERGLKKPKATIKLNRKCTVIMVEQLTQDFDKWDKVFHEASI